MGPCKDKSSRAACHTRLKQRAFVHVAGSLLPGALLNVRVQAVLSDGLAVSFLTFFNGTLDIFHLSQVQSPFVPCRMASHAS